MERASPDVCSNVYRMTRPSDLAGGNRWNLLALRVIYEPETFWAWSLVPAMSFVLVKPSC